MPCTASRRGAAPAPISASDVVVNYTGGDTWVKSAARPEGGRAAADLRRHGGFDPKEDIRFIWTFELKVLGSNGWMRSDIETLLKMVQEGKLKCWSTRCFRSRKRARRCA